MTIIAALQSSDGGLSMLGLEINSNFKNKDIKPCNMTIQSHHITVRSDTAIVLYRSDATET